MGRKRSLLGSCLRGGLRTKQALKDHRLDYFFENPLPFFCRGSYLWYHSLRCRDVATMDAVHFSCGVQGIPFSL